MSPIYIPTVPTHPSFKTEVLDSIPSCDSLFCFMFRLDWLNLLFEHMLSFLLKTSIYQFSHTNLHLVVIANKIILSSTCSCIHRYFSILPNGQYFFSQSNPYGLKDGSGAGDMSAWTSAGLQPTTGYYPYDPTLAAYG